MIIELHVFCLSDEQIKQRDMGYPTPLEDCEVRKFAFVSVAYFSRHREQSQYTVLGSSSEEFICRENYDEVYMMIQQSQTFKLN
jgi:hypothetical protein